MSKAFDCLDHQSIAETLERIGLGSCAILKDYLQHRQQAVYVGSFVSDMADITNGVPQGSILGPLIFILTLSDIESVVDEAMHLFADDITSWTESNEWPTLRQSIESIFVKMFSYLSFKGLKINMSKCHFMILGRKYLDNTKFNEPLYIEVLDNRIYEEPELKLLGVTIDNSLSFNTHITNLISKANGLIRFIWRTAKDRSEEQRRLLASTIVMPHLQYCDIVYHRHIYPQTWLIN